MGLLIRGCVVVAAVYAISTAPEADRRAMFEGAKAFADSVVGACTRDGSPCWQAISLIQNGASLAFDVLRSDSATKQADPTRRALDDSPRRSVPSRDGA